MPFSPAMESFEDTEVVDDEEHAEVTIDARTGQMTAVQQANRSRCQP